MTVRDDLKLGIAEAKLLGSDQVVIPLQTARFFYEGDDFVAQNLIQATWPEDGPEPYRDPLVRILVRGFGLNLDEANHAIDRELYYERERRERRKRHKKMATYQDIINPRMRGEVKL